jgi:tRNA uridine 5-carbamoylmethylation protein Kti12
MPRPRAACGTLAAYRRHKRMDEPVDDACAAAMLADKQAHRQEEREADANVVKLAIAAAPPIAEDTDELQELRDNLVIVKATMLDAPSNTIAALSKRRQELVADIRRLEKQARPEKSALDQLADKRAARLAAASS